MEMKPGYKQTEVGVIPKEWEVKPLGEIGGVRMCKRVLKHQTREHGDIPFYKIGTFGGVPDAFIPQSLFAEFRRKYSFPRKGDVLISAAGTIGRTVTYDGVPAYFQDSNIVWIDNDESKATNPYLWHRYQVTKWSVSHGGTVARLYNNSLRTKIHIPIPPLPEQRAITTALSDVDGLLGGLDRLIAKKRDLKQAAMQQLLNGQTRLPGFSKLWEVKALKEVCWFQEGPGVRNTQFTSSGIKLLNGTNIFRGVLNLDTTTRFISEREGRGAYAHFLADEGDIVLASSGITIERLHEKVAFVRPQDLPFCMNTSTIRFKTFARILVPAFLFQFLTGDNFKRMIGGTATGSAQLNFGPSHVEKVELSLPPLAEQTAIAEVLTDMDRELSALEQGREKTRALKQAMMQELLSGRTRLV